MVAKKNKEVKDFCKPKREVEYTCYAEIISGQACETIDASSKKEAREKFIEEMKRQYLKIDENSIEIEEIGYDGGL